MNTISLAKYQKTMGLHLRNPENEEAPQNLNERRLSVYRELVFNNVESQLAASFPVISSVLGRERWLGLVREFLCDYRAQTPYFTQLSAEFVDFLAATQGSGERPQFLLELAHYERVEIDLFMQDEEYERVSLSSENLAHKNLGLVSATQLLAYEYPVHRIAPEYLPEEAPETPTLLLLFQDDEGEVRFFELQPLAYQLVSKLSQGDGISGTKLLEQLAAEINAPFTETFEQQGMQLLEQLNNLKVLRSV